ncbi:MAG: hypothetical protein SF172_16005 [Burkholderiales bacterium]|nr:hypothetical protein [Burkholderiales bacterium]
MKAALSAALLSVSLFLGAVADAQAVTNQYRVAHVRHQGSNMVIVIINPSFFYGSRQDQQRWFTGIQQCVRSVNLAGQTLIVTNDNGRFRFYGPNDWHNFLRTIDMNWVTARVNKSLTCNF